MISLEPYQNSGKDAYYLHRLGNWGTKRLIYPWTKAKDKWQTQQLFWEHKAAPVSLQTNRTRLWRWAARKGLSGYVWRSFWKSQGKPPTYCQGMEKKKLSPPSQLQITTVIWCLPHFPVQGQPWVRRLTSRGWLCPAKPVPPSSQLYLLLSSTADGSLVTFSYYCCSAGRSISNNCSLHASSSMHLAALSLNYSQTISLWPIPTLSSASSAKVKFPSLTCRLRSSSIFSLFPNYPLHLLSFAGLWYIYRTWFFQPHAFFLLSGRNSICKSLLQYPFPPHAIPTAP